MGFDYAVHHELDSRGVDPVVMKLFSGVLDGVEVLRTEFGRIEEVSDIHTHAEIAMTPHFVEEVQHFEILSSAVHASDSVLVRPFHARMQSQELFGARGLRNDFGDQILSRLL